MPEDTRKRATYFQVETIEGYLGAYASSLKDALAAVDPAQLQKALDLMAAVRARGGQILVAGNGGSAAISDHLCCDWAKGTDVPHEKPFKIFSLTSNSALLTALANDLSYPQVFEAQLGMFARPGDALVLISSSGNSPNILRALEKARELGIQVIGLSGFDGGGLARGADISLHVPVANYGIVEDAHQALMHVIAQFTYLSSLKKRRA